MPRTIRELTRHVQNVFDSIVMRLIDVNPSAYKTGRSIESRQADAFAPKSLKL